MVLENTNYIKERFILSRCKNFALLIFKPGSQISILKYTFFSGFPTIFSAVFDMFNSEQ
jgi:hypothetical protein